MGPSQYVTQLSPFAVFIQRFGQVLPPGAHPEQVFVIDGAQWIHHWLPDRYPHAPHILDFYHVAEKLAAALAARTPPGCRPNTTASAPASARPSKRP